MAMTWTSLTSPKGTSGSIMNWVNYSKLDINPVVDEAQALLYATLRTREMMSKYNFNIALNSSYIPLPANFLDPIGRIIVPTLNVDIAHKDANYLMRARNFQENTGTLGTNALTTTSGSTQIEVNLPNHGFVTESVFNLSGATSFNGVNPNGTFDVVSIVDVNNFMIDTLTQSATLSGAGGGAAMVYIVDVLTGQFPEFYAIWDEQLHFDGAFTQSANCQLLYYKSLPLLSASNQSNFLTNRYPQLMRTACQTAAADFMKDDPEYTKCLQRLVGMVQQVSVDNDGQYRGIEVDAYTP